MVLPSNTRTASARFSCTGARFAVCCAAVALFSLWIRTGVPVFALADAGEDDALFVRLAHALAAGHWLGAFDKLTLVKGMAYPLFIACSFWLGLPLKLAEQGTYLAACLLTAALVRRHTPRGSWAAVPVFAVLALDPLLWTTELARVIREGLYIGLSLALVTLSAWVSFAPRGGGRRGAAASLGLGVALGILAAAFWLTREEGLWLAPALAVNLGLGGVEAVRAWRRGRGLTVPPRRPRGVPGIVLSWAGALAVFSTLVVGVAWINQSRYGAFETTEVQSLAFRRAYGALARVGQEHPRRYVVFSKDARDAAYAVSPAARELAPTLDGPVGEARRRAGCAEAEQTDCPEILAGWFQWALRDAVSAAGHYAGADAAAAYYDRLAAEIDDACRRGALRCLPPRATLAPPFRWDAAADALRTFPRLADVLLHLGEGSIGAKPSLGQPTALADMADLVGPIAPPVTLPQTMRGWAAAAAGTPLLRVLPAPGASPSEAGSRITVEPAPDVARAWPALEAVRFSFDTRGSDLDSVLVVEEPDGRTASLPLASLRSGVTLEEAGTIVHLDDGAASAAPAAGEERRRAIVRVAQRITDLYVLAMPAACGLACAGLAAAWVWRRHHAASPLLVALALSGAVGVLCRLALLSYLDATAIPAVNNLYPSPAAPLLLLFAGLGCGLGVTAVRGRAEARRRAREPRPDQER